MSLKATSKDAIDKRFSFLWDLFLLTFDGPPSDIVEVGVTAEWSRDHLDHITVTFKLSTCNHIVLAVHHLILLINQWTSLQRTTGPIS